MRTPNLTSPNRRPTAEDTVRPSAAKTDSNRSPEVSSSSAPRPAHADHPDAFENLAGNTGSHSALQQTPSLSEWQKLAESTKAEVATLAPKEKIAWPKAASP